MSLYFKLLDVSQFLFYAYGYVLIATAVISWIPDLVQTKMGHALQLATDPYVRLFRFIPKLRLGGVALDLSFAAGVAVYFAVLVYAFNVLFHLLMRS